MTSAQLMRNQPVQRSSTSPGHGDLTMAPVRRRVVHRCHAPPAILRTASRIQNRNEPRHAEIHELHSKGLPIAAIPEQLHLDRTTVRKFVRVNSAADFRRTIG